MSHVVNPNSLRLGFYSLNWSYSYKFSEINKLFKLHLELNFLLTQFLKIYGISLVKYHISFENSGLKLNLVVFRLIYRVSPYKIAQYLKEDTRALNNPFSSFTNILDWRSTYTDTRFLSHKRVLTRLRILGLRRDPRRWSKQNYTWYWKNDSVFEQQFNSPGYQLQGFRSRSLVLPTFLKKKFLYYLSSKRVTFSYHLANIYSSKKFLHPRWFPLFEKFCRLEYNAFLNNRTKKSDLFPVSRELRFANFKLWHKKLFTDKFLKFVKHPFTFLHFKKKSSIADIESISTFITLKLKKYVLLFNLMYCIQKLSKFFFVGGWFYNFLLLKYFTCYIDNAKKVIVKNTYYYKESIITTQKFTKLYINNFYPLLSKKKLFFTNWALKSKNASMLNTYLKNKLLLLCLTNLLIDKFNLVFFVNLFNASTAFTTEKMRDDLSRNMVLVKKWAYRRYVKHFNYFYFVFLLSMRLRITGPISSFLAILLGKTVYHYKFLFCVKNIMLGLSIRSPQLITWKGTVVDAVGRVNGSDRKKYCRYSSSRMFPLSTFDTIVNQSQRRSISKYGLINIKVLSFWHYREKKLVN